MYAFVSFLNLPDNSLMVNTFSTIVLGLYAIIGMIDLSETFVFYSLILLSIPYYISTICNESKDFFYKYGISEVNIIFYNLN